MREQAIIFFKELRDRIIVAFEQYEPSQKFHRKEWAYQAGEGGGEMSLLRGTVFEKAAVNWSGVAGERFPMQDGEGPFFATGLSLITHMFNPHAPTVHMNIRYIETAHRHWFGGGYDLTPMGYPYSEDTQHFHQVAKQTLDAFDPALYPQFSQNAREYFCIPHYGVERGVGGIFFDHFNTGNFERDFSMCQKVGDTFLDAILPILDRRIHTPFSEAEKDVQTRFRGRYVEFNLLYDRGTKFGFQSGGNPEAILCSLPPVVKW